MGRVESWLNQCEVFVEPSAVANDTPDGMVAPRAHLGDGSPSSPIHHIGDSDAPGLAAFSPNTTSVSELTELSKDGSSVGLLHESRMAHGHIETSKDMGEDDPLTSHDDVHIEVKVEQNSGKLKHRRTVNCFHLTFMAFFLTSGGPFGIEDVVSSGGPLFTIIAFLSFPFLYCLPQALMTAELANMITENGGYVLWVQRAFGDFWAFLAGYNGILNGIFDLALYPVLFVDYVAELPPIKEKGLSFGEMYAIKLAVVAVVMYLNIRGLQIVGTASAVMAIIVLLPFVLEFFFAVDKLDPEAWGKVPEHVNWSLFLNNALWGFTGWAQLGTVAGEVKNPQKNYPKSVLSSIMLNAAVYTCPVMVGLSYEPDWRKWTAGFFSHIAWKVRPWIGWWVMVAAMCSSFSMFNVNVSTVSRTVWAFSGGAEALGKPKFPSFFGYSHKTYQTPVASILLLGVLVCGLMSLSFSNLVQFDVFFNAFVLILEFAAFIWLRFKEPDTPRPYRVPWGWFGAWLTTIVKGILVLCVLSFTRQLSWIVGVSYNAVLCCAYYVWQRCMYRRL